MARLRAPAPPDPRSLPAVLRAWLRRRRLRPSSFVLGAKGAAGRRVRREWLEALRGLAPRSRVVSDLEIAHRAAFGGGAGVLVTAGTGSCAFGRDARGRAARAGGRGPLLGDEGSAFWIGRRWARGLPEREVLALARRRRPVRAVAALAPRVLARARRGDPRARRIVREARTHLARQAAEVARVLGLGAPIPVSWNGGLFRERTFLRAFLADLPGGLRRWKPLGPGRTPELAAALWAAPPRRLAQSPTRRRDGPAPPWTPPRRDGRSPLPPPPARRARRRRRVDPA